MIKLLAYGQIHAFRGIFSSAGSTGVIRGQEMYVISHYLIGLFIKKKKRKKKNHHESEHFVAGF